MPQSKIILTKKRLAMLSQALSMDDILYERFKRLNEQLRRDADRLINNRKKIFSVVKRVKGENYLMAMRIVDVHMTESGSEIIVED